jgi:hypothetical protein
MPLIYRAMTRDNDGRPKVGTTARTLGVRLPPDPKPDITPDSNGVVRPGTGGMSVAPAWRRLPLYRIPRRLRHLVPQAHGKDEDACWTMGDGPFADGTLAAGLALRVDSARHGLVEPDGEMTVEAYQEALAATRDHWTVDEG